MGTPGEDWVRAANTRNKETSSSPLSSISVEEEKDETVVVEACKKERRAGCRGHINTSHATTKTRSRGTTKFKEPDFFEQLNNRMKEQPVWRIPHQDLRGNSCDQDEEEIYYACDTDQVVHVVDSFYAALGTNICTGSNPDPIHEEYRTALQKGLCAYDAYL